jgi:hypothetical protein
MFIAVARVIFDQELCGPAVSGVTLLPADSYGFRRTAIRVIRSAIAFAMIGGCSRGFCQSGVEPPSPIHAQTERYEAFFRQVAELRNVSGPVTLINGKPVESNGRLVEITLPKAQEAIGLTDQEANVLNAIASDCEASIREYDVSVRPLVFETRLQALASEDAPSAAAAQLLMDLDNQRNQIVLDHVRRVKAAFGDLRFLVLDEWVRSRKQANFFPPAGAPVRGN